MTLCATKDPGRTAPPSAATGPALSADGNYAARLARDPATGARFPERWTLGGPHPYAVSLRQDQPEEADSRLLPLADGRVLVCRRVADRLAFALLYPTGPGTGEVPLGTLDTADTTDTTDAFLLPPAPDGRHAYLLAPGADRSVVWLLGGGSGPERVAEVPGRCSGGAWLDRETRLLALDRERDGRTKTVVLDLSDGAVTPLLELTDESEDRLLLADPDSGLLIVRSDAPGRPRLGWGVLGGTRPFRFPECLAPRGGVRLTPIAAQPGRVLDPEGCAVAFRVDGPVGSWVAVWRPESRRLIHLPAPDGWLAGTALWTSGGELRLPHVDAADGCAVATLTPWSPPQPAAHGTAPEPAPGRHAARPEPGAAGPEPERRTRAAADAGAGAAETGGDKAAAKGAGARGTKAGGGREDRRPPTPARNEPPLDITLPGAGPRPVVADAAPVGGRATGPVPLQQSPLAALRRRGDRTPPASRRTTRPAAPGPLASPPPPPGAATPGPLPADRTAPGPGTASRPTPPAPGHAPAVTPALAVPESPPRAPATAGRTPPAARWSARVPEAGWAAASVLAPASPSTPGGAMLAGLGGAGEAADAGQWAAMLPPDPHDAFGLVRRTRSVRILVASRASRGS